MLDFASQGKGDFSRFFDWLVGSWTWIPVIDGLRQRTSDGHFISAFSKAVSLGILGVWGKRCRNTVAVGGWAFGLAEWLTAYSRVKSYLFPYPKLVVLRLTLASTS